MLWKPSDGSLNRFLAFSVELKTSKTFLQSGPQFKSKFREKFINFENLIFTHHKARTLKYYFIFAQIFQMGLKNDDGIVQYRSMTYL